MVIKSSITNPNEAEKIHKKCRRLKQLLPTTSEEILNEVNAKLNELTRMFEEIKGMHGLIIEKSVEMVNKLVEYRKRLQRK